MPKILCKHCGINKAAQRKRGLCQRCYCNPLIRDVYPCGNACRGAFATEMTEEQVEALVAQQYANLPSWWDSENKNREAELHNLFRSFWRESPEEKRARGRRRYYERKAKANADRA